MTLTIEPGVNVRAYETSASREIDIEVWGELGVAGQASDKIILKCVGIQGKSGSKIDIEYAFFDGQPCASGNRVSVNGRSGPNNGELKLRNSIFNHASRMYLGDSDIIENNMFLNSIWTGELAISGNVIIKNNLFYNPKVNSIMTWGETKDSVIKYNTFLSCPRTTGAGIYHVKLNGNTELDVSENYWDTDDGGIIVRMIYDRTDDLNLDNYVSYIPYLDKPHPDTPEIFYYIYIDREIKLVDRIMPDVSLANSLSGLILLKVESNGEAWYVYPGNNERYFLGRPEDAFQIMRELGLGTKHDFIENNTVFPEFVSGKILLDIEQNGEAYYIYPKDRKAYYLGRPEDAFEIMRELGLGVANNDIYKIKISRDYYNLDSLL